MTASILNKIRNLRARASCDASSENEVLHAIKMADKLMKEHNINLSDLEVKKAGAIQHIWQSGRITRPVEMWATPGIAKLTDTQIFYSGGDIYIVGTPTDVEIATYYIDLVSHAIKNEWSKYPNKGLVLTSVRKFGNAFRKGVAYRLSERFKEMVAPPPPSQSRDLLIVKDQLIKDYLNDNNINLRNNKTSIPDFGGREGMAAAENIHISKGVTQCATA